MMKKVLAGIIAFCMFVCVFTGCVVKENSIEMETETAVAENENLSDEYIVEKFYEAWDFWFDWIYYQEIDFYSDSVAKDDSGRYLIDERMPIQTAEELKAEIKKHFSNELCDKFTKQLSPKDIDGRLYVYTCDGMDYYDKEIDHITIEKKGDDRYLLKLDVTTYDGESYKLDSFVQYVYYIFEDGRWAFENEEEDEFFFEGRVPGYNNEAYEPYNRILETYYDALRLEWDAEKIDEHGLVDIISAFHGVEPLKCVGYSLMDINSDGQNELLIGKVNAQNNIVWDMYSVKNGEAYRVLTSLERNRHYIFENEGKYMVANERHGSAMDYEYTYSDFDGEKLNIEKSIAYEGENLYMNGEPIDEKTATEITESYSEKYISIDFISFETLG